MEKVTIKTRTASGKWIFAIAFTFLFQLSILASDTDLGDFGGGDNPTDAPAEPLPIDDSVFVLLATAIGYAFYKYKAFSKQTKVESIL